MRMRRVISSLLFLMLAHGIGFHLQLRPVAFASDQVFDSYGDISWQNEKAHLDNFAIALKQDSTLMGYIIVYAGKSTCVGEAKGRGRRAKKYLVKSLSIPEHRIKVVDGGYREKLTVILQPVPADAPEIIPTPTLKSTDVQIRKNCKSIPKPRVIRQDNRGTNGLRKRSAQK